MRSDRLPGLAEQVAEVVREVMALVRPRLVAGALSGQHTERPNQRHADNFLSEHDLCLHEQYRQLLSGVIGSFVYASEEGEPAVVGSDPEPDLCVLVDPLDTSELAVRALHGYTHVMVYSRALARPVLAVVGDIFHHLQLYVGVLDDAGADRALLVTADGALHPLAPSTGNELSELLVTNYLMRPAERLEPLARQRRLLAALSASAAGRQRGRIGVDFGSVGLAHVAAGFTDAMIEFAKGFAVWDLAPGHYLLHAAGGYVVDLDGTPLPLDYQLGTLQDIAGTMKSRQRFVAAGSLTLAQKLASLLDPDDTAHDERAE